MSGHHNEHQNNSSWWRLVDVDPQLLIQQLMTASSGMYDEKRGIFQYELWNYPSSLFDSSGIIRASHTSELAGQSGILGECCGVELPGVS